MRLGVRLPLGQDDLLFLVRQRDTKPSHERPPCQNHAVLLDGNQQELYDQATGYEQIIPCRAEYKDQTLALPNDTPLLHVPKQLVKNLNRDLAAAGIAKRDDRGRTLDVHALRHSFGTLLSAGGVTPRTAQAAMRHSDIGLTMNVYTDPRLLDVGATLDALPALPLGSSPFDRGQEAKSTGTDSRRTSKLATTNPKREGKKRHSSVAPTVAPTSGDWCKLGDTGGYWGSFGPPPPGVRKRKNLGKYRGF